MIPFETEHAPETPAWREAAAVWLLAAMREELDQEVADNAIGSADRECIFERAQKFCVPENMTVAKVEDVMQMIARQRERSARSRAAQEELRRLGIEVLHTPEGGVVAKPLTTYDQ